MVIPLKQLDASTGLLGGAGLSRPDIFGSWLNQEPLMRRTLLSFGFAVGLTLNTLGTALAFLEDTPPSFSNGGTDPIKTTDPAAVAAAQKALGDFFAYTNLTYSIAGYSNPRLMREDIGNSQNDWLDMTMPLACGRMIGGWKGMNWIPAKGWSHSSPGLLAGAAANVAVSCLYSPPTLANGGADPSTTSDPAAVAAAQKALTDFYSYTNLNYSDRGYSNPQVMREVVGNSGNDWLDQALDLARGRLVGGWKFMNWVSGKGWCHCAAPSSQPGRTSGQHVAVYSAWDAQVPGDNASLPRSVPSRLGTIGNDAEAQRVVDETNRIKGSLGVDLGTSRIPG